jgi:prevent-host-death family protein
MGSLPIIIPVSELRQDAAGVIKRATATHEPVVVTQRGRATAVLIDVETYGRSQHELELLRDLLRGQAEIRAGVGHSLEEVLADVDALLANGPEQATEGA